MIKLLNCCLVTGEIPASLGQLTNLARLYLDKNLLKGDTLAADFNGFLKAYSTNFLNLLCGGAFQCRFNNYDTRLAGEIPASLSQLTNLTYVSVERNQLRGKMQ